MSMDLTWYSLLTIAMFFIFSALKPPAKELLYIYIKSFFTFAFDAVEIDAGL